MPQFKIAKTKDNDKIINNAIIEDKLYIYKETNKIGRMFYDFDENTRIEIGSLDNVYTCVDDINDDTATIKISSLRKYLSDDNLSTVNIDEIQLNSLVTVEKSIYNIRDIFRDGDNSTVTIRRIYSQQDLTWNDYYG